jgi:hypothetical protein
MTWYRRAGMWVICETSQQSARWPRAISDLWAAASLWRTVELPLEPAMEFHVAIVKNGWRCDQWRVPPANLWRDPKCVASLPNVLMTFSIGEFQPRLVTSRMKSTSINHLHGDCWLTFCNYVHLLASEPLLGQQSAANSDLNRHLNTFANSMQPTSRNNVTT